MSAEEEKAWITIFGVKVFLVIASNVGLYALANYEKIIGSVFTILSTCYLIWRWRTEYLKNKKNENIS
jgi:threonine/homoserine/homoserine lactone efflux protein